MALAIKSFYEFDEFKLDNEEKVLFKRGKPVAVTPKVLQLLAVLVENHGRILEKDDLMNQVWAESFVEESNLTFTVRQLRKVLGDDAHKPRFIETVPRRGYRFIADVREVLTDEFSGNPNLSVRLKYEPNTQPFDRYFIDETFEEKKYAQSFEQTRKSRKYVVFGLIAFIAIILGVSSFIIYRKTYTQLHPPNFRQMTLTRLTSFGDSYLSAISPDGKYIIHVKDEGGKQSLLVRQINETRDVEIVSASETKFYGITVSPDSKRVFYTAWDINKSDYILYQVPILGGTPQKLSDTISSAVTFSPDGEQMAFFFAAASVGTSRLVISKKDGSEPRILARRKQPDTFETEFGSPAWSPDGKSIVAVGASMSIGMKSNLIVFNVEHGTEKPLTEPKWEEIQQVTWLHNGSGLLMIARAASSHPNQIWLVSYPGGEARKITNDLNDYRGLSLTADSKMLITTQKEQTSRLWVSPSDSIEDAKHILSETGTTNTEGLAWTSDGKIIFRFRENGRDDIWQITTVGSERKQLTVNADNNVQPTVCRDTIVFASKRTGVYRLWRIDKDGSNPKPLTTKSDDSELFPSCSPNGEWVIYQKGWRKASIWKVPVNGGEPLPVVEPTAIRPAVSPDGKLAAYYYLDSDVWWLSVIPIEGDKPLQKFPLPSSVVSRFVRWTPDSKALAYIDTNGGVSNIRLQSLDGSPPQLLTNFNTEHIFYFDWSHNGKIFAFSRGTITSNVISINSVD